jgi:hypothetical protein
MARRGPKGPTHERSRDELEEHLRRQVAFLATSAAAVDAGNPDVAIRLAVTVRVLCHDGTGVALLKLLGLNKRLRYVNTAHSIKDLPPGSFVHDFGLARVRTEFDPPSVTAYAPLDDLWEERTNPQRFEDWWTTPFLTNQSVIARARPGFTYSRKNVVLALANKDGAHVDPRFPPTSKRSSTTTAALGGP